jgi:hypothetical protein
MGRKEVEARRGIVRDDEGHIVHSKEWLKARIEWLKAKDADMAQRRENIKVELEQREQELSEL